MDPGEDRCVRVYREPVHDHLAHDLLRRRYESMVVQVYELGEVLIELGLEPNENIGVVDLAILRLREAYT